MAEYTARRLPKQPGPAAWNALLPTRVSKPKLQRHATADIAIIGGGFAGLTAARHLFRLDPSLTIAVLEAGEIAEGPAGRNSGFMIDLPHNISSDNYSGSSAAKDKAQIRLHRLAISFAQELAAEAQLPREFFDPAGKINAAASESSDQHNRDFGAYLSSLGEPNELLDARAMREITGIAHYTTGLYTPGTVMIQPAAYIRALAEALGRGAVLYENTPVLAIKRTGASWSLQTPQGALAASKVIIATNGHLESFGFFRRKLMHIFTYASMTRALRYDEVKKLGGRPNWGVTPSAPGGTTVRRISGSSGDRLLVRSRYSYNPSMTVSEGGLASAGRLHDRKFAQRFPQLRGVAMEYRWAGHMCLTLNGVAAFGLLGDGIVSAACDNGLGTVNSTITGLASAEVALGRKGEASSALSEEEAPKRIPPEPFAFIGANMNMRWKEWRAGKE